MRYSLYLLAGLAVRLERKVLIKLLGWDFSLYLLQSRRLWGRR